MLIFRTYLPVQYEYVTEWVQRSSKKIISRDSVTLPLFFLNSYPINANGPASFTFLTCNSYYTTKGNILNIGCYIPVLNVTHLNIETKDVVRFTIKTKSVYFRLVFILAKTKSTIYNTYTLFKQGSNFMFKECL